MPLNRPTLQQIIDRVEGDIKTGLGLATLLRRSFEKVISRVIAGVSHVLHGAIEFIFIQFFPDTAIGEFLLRWAVIFGILQKESTFAELNITVTGLDGSTVPQGTIYQRSDGFEYLVKDDIDIGVSGSQTGVVVAKDAGTEGNIDDGSTISLTSSISGVDSDATVDSTAIEGEQEETTEELRTRLIERIQAPPQGGAAKDYIAFAKTVAGVTRAWVLPGHLGEGTVGLTFVEDNEVPIIPDQPKVDEVQLAVEALKPITADLFVFAPGTEVVDLTIAILPNTQAVRDAVTTEITDLIFREAQVRGAFKQVGETYDGRIALSKFGEAISTADGEDEHEIIFPTIGNDPQPDVGGLLVPGTLTFQTLIP